MTVIPAIEKGTNIFEGKLRDLASPYDFLVSILFLSTSWIPPHSVRKSCRVTVLQGLGGRFVKSTSNPFTKFLHNSNDMNIKVLLGLAFWAHSFSCADALRVVEKSPLDTIARELKDKPGKESSSSHGGADKEESSTSSTSKGGKNPPPPNSSNTQGKYSILRD